MYRTSLITAALVLSLSRPAVAAESEDIANLLRNPLFGFHSREEASESGNNVTCWNTDCWGDITAVSGSRKSELPLNAAENIVRIEPGKRLWQFAALSELGLANGDSVSLAVKGYQEAPEALRTRLCLMLIESAEGTWSPQDFGFSDKRTFSRHGRGELVRSPVLEATSDRKADEFSIKVEGLRIDPHCEHDRKSSPAFRNVVGVLVEFANVSQQDAWIHSPTLVHGSRAIVDLKSSRPLPDYYRQIPRAIEKLVNGRPLHVLTLGSSIDRGSANPPLYLYEEDAGSPHYREPLCESRPSSREEIERVLAEKVGRPDLRDYVGWWQHYFMYTGRMRLELMRKFNYPIDKILLNVMACDGSSIGESHSGFREYAALEIPPEANRNGHPPGKAWSDIYPELFQRGDPPAPDLVVFGHGHNEHIDRPDEIAAYEGAIRWFQRHYPEVEFVSCMWIRDKGEEFSMTDSMRALCDHYGIPFVDAGQLLVDLKSTCNDYALAVDGGHPGAAGHYLWFKQLEQVFEIPPSRQPGTPQRHLPERLNRYSYGWEGDITRFQESASRFVAGKMMIIEDCAFNVWASNKGQPMKISIDSRAADHAGHGRHSWSRPDPRNSAFVHGRLSLGDRHIIEIHGDNAKLVAVDCKVCPRRAFFDAGSGKWQGAKSMLPFESNWGAPYGNRMFRLAAGAAIEIEAEATDFSLAYLDRPAGGTLRVEVDGKQAWSRATNVPFEDSTGAKHFIENRRAIAGFEYRKHRIRLEARGGEVCVLGLFTYDSRP
jgi:hypothetical protein